MPITSTLVAETQPRAPLVWVLGWARQVDRQAMRCHLGQPVFTETDGTRTFGGEEDWWLYRASNGEAVGVCLRVPYGDAVFYSSVPSATAAAELAVLLTPWAVEVFEEPYAR